MSINAVTSKKNRILDKLRSNQLWIFVLGFASWIILIGYTLFSVPIKWWRWRDDAVITLSHAQNLVNYGSIGISPGDRVEGFSSPLQFLISSIFFRATGKGYGLFLDLQVFICIGLAGALIAITSYNILNRNRSQDEPFNKILIPVFASVLSGLIASASWTSIGWLASGMENPLIVVIGLTIVYISSLKPNRKNLILASTMVGVLGIARVEFAAFTLPMCANVALLLPRKFKYCRHRYIAIAFFIPVSIWALTHFARLMYFGNLLPNTAIVQGRESNSIFKLLLLLVLYSLYIIASIALSKLPRNKLLQAWKLLAYAAMISPALFIFSPQSLKFPYFLGFAMLVSLICYLQYLRLRIPEFDLPQTLIFTGLLFIPLAQYTLMGDARMEWSRVLSIATPWMAAWIALSVTSLLSYRGRIVLPFQNKVESFIVLLPTSIGILGSALLDKPRDMPWIISPREQRILNASSDFKKKMFNSDPLILSASPDLGKLSFEKKLMITDLGGLGDPLLALLNKNSNSLRSKYLNEVAKPDIVQAHKYWSCMYSDWIYSKAFQSNYELISGDMTLYSDTPCPNDGRDSIWRRKADLEAVSEYSLTDKMISGTDPIASIKPALDRCLVSGKDPFRCSFIARSIRRSYIRLKKDNLLQTALYELKKSPSYALDFQMITKGPGWEKKAYIHFIELSKQYQVNYADNQSPIY